MSNEKSSDMTVNIGKRVKNYVVFFVVLFLFLIWSNDIIALITKTIYGDKDQSELARKVITSVITFLLGIAIFLLNLGRDINLHNIIDNTFFHVRKKTGSIIESRMIEAAQKVGAKSSYQMRGKTKEIMYLFYHFANANEQTNLRALAFTYWEQYFVNIYIILFGLISFIASTIFTVANHKWGFSLTAPIILAFITIIVALSTRFSLIKKIYDLPVQQIEEIRTGKSAELKDEVEKRFGGLILR